MKKKKRKPTPSEIKKVANLITKLEKEEITYKEYRKRLSECNKKLGKMQ